MQRVETSYLLRIKSERKKKVKLYCNREEKLAFNFGSKHMHSTVLRLSLLVMHILKVITSLGVCKLGLDGIVITTRGRCCRDYKR